ncbi:hypothetical protein G7Y79_00020g047820 [Physcia stellaris]|nr:hypothetical protein G7Y79_00020g047820 [Physcia stellaris]
MNQAFAPPSRRTTYSKLHDDDLDPHAPKRVTTSNLEAQNAFSHPHSDSGPQGISDPSIAPLHEPGIALSQQESDGHFQSQQYYAVTDRSAKPAPQTKKTVFPPLRPRRKFNKHIMIPSIVAVTTVIIIVTLVICYVAGAFGG